MMCASGSILPAILLWAGLSLAAAAELPSVSALPGGLRPAAGPSPVRTETEDPAAGIGPPAAPVGGRLYVPPGGPGFVLKEVRFDGGANLPDTGIENVIGPFLGQWVTLADLEELRFQLTKHYVDQGYINSGVVLKSGQRVEDGVIFFEVIEGRLDEIRVSGNGGLRAEYIQDRIATDGERPFNRNALQERFQLLLQDSLIDQINGTLLPGTEPGSAVLDLEITRARPWELYLRTDNYRPPSTGAERAYLGGVLRNLTGFGDALELYIGRGFEGQGREGSIAFSIPVTADNTRLFTRYARSDASLLEDPLVELDIDSETQRFELGVSHPIRHSLEHSLTLGALVSWSENETTLLGEPFSFSEGAIRGESRVTALRFFQEYAKRGSKQALALRSVFSMGVDAFDATIHTDNTPDGEFFVWLGQGQYVRRLSERGTQLIIRGGVQLAGETLLPLERFAVGGVNTVRGYRENQLVGDSGYAATVEIRHPLWEGKGPADTDHVLQIAAYTDVGSAWNHGGHRDREGLFSIGAGLLWTVRDRLRAELYLAHAIKDPPPSEEHNIQDDGIHFLIQADF